ncbi:mitochondrial ribosomal protein L27-domain-containing protein [Bombardia bombarda]|uniref:Mitochondrial ribosomal protein L27-domain-containing protein n=1 Tax=Bombardia bombarda TaxID=252184 RepID=A0AA40C8R6_9PEZI|nr:mitochondrial ribosomal protein L27-domain-containing protein [Bombardia bombarda]
MQPTRVLQGLRYRKLRLTTKDVNKGFYKGSGTGTVGRHTKHGGFVIEWEKVRSYVCPPLEGFKLTPFVAATVPKVYGQFSDAQGPRNPETYLARWKSENALD